MKKVTKLFIIFLVLFLLTLPRLAQPMGGQLGLEFAIDAPWRIEPVPDTATGSLIYGPIPIIITFHDAIFDDMRGTFSSLFLQRLHVGTLKGVTISEFYDSDNATAITTNLTPQQLREIERKQLLSTKHNEPPHEVCNLDIGVNCEALFEISMTHEWHGMFWYAPKLDVVLGRNIRLRVSVNTEHEGKPRSWVNDLVVHAGERPLPRFSNSWLYGDLHYHSQMTDNEGESAYSYRNVVRAMGAMGMDFIFATDHASDGTQIDGGLALLRKNGDPLGEPCDTKPGDAGEAFRIDLNNLDGKNASCRRVLYKEARDLNKKRFLYAKRILYGTGTANQGVAEDIENRGMANYLSRGLLPKIFMGEEVDA